MKRVATSLILDAPIETVEKVLGEVEEFLEALPFVKEVRQVGRGVEVTMSFSRFLSRLEDTYRVETYRRGGVVVIQLTGRKGVMTIALRATPTEEGVRVDIEGSYRGRSEGLVREKLSEIVNAIRSFIAERVSEEVIYAPQVRRVLGRDVELSDVLSVSTLLLSSTLLESAKVPPGAPVYSVIEKYVGEPRGLLLITIDAGEARGRMLIDNGRIEGAYLEKGFDHFMGSDALDEIRRLTGPATVNVWLVVKRRGASTGSAPMPTPS